MVPIVILSWLHFVDQTRVIEQTDTGTNFDALPIIIGSIGAVFIILMIIVVVHIKRRSFCERKGKVFSEYLYKTKVRNKCPNLNNIGLYLGLFSGVEL